MNVKRALIVDDSKSARFSLRKKLQVLDLGLEIELAESGTEVIDQLKTASPEHYPDIIFMDHFMPGMDGFETTRSIKGNPVWSNISVVMCTSKEGDEYLKEARDHGAVAILPKPSTQKQILEAIEQVNSSLSQTPSSSQPLEQPAVKPSKAPDSHSTTERTAQSSAPSLDSQAVEQIVQEQLTLFQKTLQEKIRGVVSPLVLPLIQSSVSDKVKTQISPLEMRIDKIEQVQASNTIEDTQALIKCAIEAHNNQVDHNSSDSEQLGALESKISSTIQLCNTLQSSVDKIPQLELKAQQLEEHIKLQEELQNNQESEVSEALTLEIQTLSKKAASDLIAPLTEQIATEMEKGLQEIIRDVQLEIDPLQKNLKQLKTLASVAIGLGIVSLGCSIFL